MATIAATRTWTRKRISRATGSVFGPQAALDRAESTMSFLRPVELREHPVKGSFDLAPLRAIHKRLFDDLYDRAGKIRQVEIQKGDTIFARRVVIDSAAQQLFGQLAKEDFLRHLDADPFSERAAHFLGEINVLHPFRDGMAAHSVNSSANWRALPGTASIGAASARAT